MSDVGSKKKVNVEIGRNDKRNKRHLGGKLIRKMIRDKAKNSKKVIRKRSDL